MSDPSEEETRSQLLRGLRIAVLLVVAAAVLLRGGFNLVFHHDAHEHLLAQVCAFASLGIVLVVEAVLLALRRSWGRLRRAAVVVVLAAAALSYATLPEGSTATTTDWVFGAANWVGLAVLLDRPLRAAMAFLLAHQSVALLNLLLLHEVSRAALLRFAIGSVDELGMPLLVAVAAAALRSISSTAARAREKIERVRTEEAVEAESHRRRQQRFADLAATTVPLLDGLAHGTLTPEDSEVQRRCAIEAARMRRLFAESDTVANPLLHELRHCADVADRKGVVVELDSRGRWPTPPVAVRRDLTEAALTALATATSWARVTVIGDDDLVSVSVVADCGEVDVPRPASPGVDVHVVCDDRTAWIEARWRPISSPLRRRPP